MHARIVVACLLLTAPTLLVAQQAGTIPQFSTIEAHEYDTINLGTLGIQLNVPIRSKAGHIPYSYRLAGASQISMEFLSKGGQVFQLARGLAPGEAHIAEGLTVGSINNNFESNFSVTDAMGVSHPFPTTLGISLVCTDVHTAGAYAADNSGLYLLLSNDKCSFTNTLYDMDGNSQIMTSSAGAPLDTLTDPNGNALSATTDTLGQTAMTPSGIGTLTAKFVWTDALNNNQTDTLTSSLNNVYLTFGCASDQPNIESTALPQSVSFPDNSSLAFGWEKNQLNNSYYTGRIASITLPTGGSISYSYSGGTHGVNCIDGSPATMKRTTPDGTWTYTHVPPSSTSCTNPGMATTTVQDPQGNNTVYTFNVGTCNVTASGDWGLTLEAERQVYKGSVATTNLIQTVITCYNNTSSSPTNCPAYIGDSVTEKDVYTTYYTTYPNTTGYSAVKTSYDTYGRVADVKTYDFGLVLINEKKILYGTGSPSSQTCGPISSSAPGMYIIDKPCSVTLYDSQNGNAILSQTWNSYNTTGDLVQTWNLVSGSGSSGTYLSKQYTYDTHGVVQTMIDVNGQIMNYTTTSCNDMFVTSQYPTNFSNLSTSKNWDCNGGVVTSSTDANGKTTHTDYATTGADPFYRPMDTKDELGNITTLSYTPNSTESVFSFNGGSSVIEVLSTTDSIGRPVTEQLAQGPAGANWDTRTRSFDSDGRLYQTSLPCVTTAKGTGCGASTESQTYDALNRPLIHTGTGGDIITKTYYGNDVTTTLTPAPSGENSKSIHKEFDGLGRLKSACTITGATGSAGCQQLSSGSGFLKQYFYDGAGRLLKTVENAQVSSPQQPRSYTYDLLGRVLTEKNPENGTITYVYDSDSTCGTSKGDLVKRTDQAGNVTCYAYDGLHRLTKKTYPSGPYAANTPTRNFVYDTTTFSCPNGSNVEGRLAEEYTGTSASKITDRAYCYSARGEVTDISESTPNSGGYYHITKSYWEDGALQTLSGIPGVPTINYGAGGAGLDGEGRVTQVSASSGTNPVTSVSYVTSNGTGQPIGALTQVVFGSTSGPGDSDSFSYDPNTGRMTQYTFTVNGQSVIGKPSWNANGTVAELNITQDPFDAGNVQDCTYGYDDLVRVASTTCKNGSTIVWSQTFGYDQFGNIAKSGSSAWACASCYDQTTNHYNGVLSGQITYDANGNLTYDTFHHYQWDSEGHMVWYQNSDGSQSSQTYDATGHMVEQNYSYSNGDWIGQYLYDENGYEYGFSHPSSIGWIYIPLPGGATAVYSGGNPPNYYLHADWLKSGRLSSTPDHAMLGDMAFAPYGEQYATAGYQYDDVFAGMKNLLVGDEFDAEFREYHPGQGRWISPDPTRGTGNKYVYADNNPLAKVDISGLYAVEVEGLEVATVDDVLDYAAYHSESAPPQSQQTGGQTTTQPSSGNGSSASTQTAAGQQQEVADANQYAGQQAKEAQNKQTDTVVFVSASDKTSQPGGTGTYAERTVDYEAGKTDKNGTIHDIDRNAKIGLDEKLDPRSTIDPKKASLAHKGDTKTGTYDDWQTAPAHVTYRTLRQWYVNGDAVSVQDPETHKAYQYELNTMDANSQTPIKTEYTNTAPF